jgi:tripartite-type tricarboxylate transporter receptor subunit TctC
VPARALTARIDLPAGSLQEFIAYAKANPGKATYASQSNGSTSHLAASNLAALAGIEPGARASQRFGICGSRSRSR